jgi:iron complex outermembrane receptor protein
MDTRQGDDATWKSVNHTRLNSLGAEFSAKLDMGGLLPRQQVLRTVSVSYSYIHQDKELEEGMVSQYALEYLRHKLVANAQLHLVSRLDIGLNLRWQDRVGRYTDFEGNVCDYAPFCLLDGRLTWTASRYRLYLEANNLLNRSYVDYGHVPQPGIWLIAGCSLNLSLFFQ